MEFIGPWIAVALTLIVLSRAFGDNPIFRFSQYLFVGLALGYSATVLVSNFFLVQIEPAVNDPTNPDQLLLLIPIILGMMLWTRIGRQQLSWLANIPLALIFGVAAALALTGTIIGTLLPQIKSSTTGLSTFAADPAAAAGRWVVLVGMILVLLSFTFTRQVPTGAPPAGGAGRGALSGLGRWLLIISLGVVFAGTMVTYQSALINRIQFLTSQFGLS